MTFPARAVRSDAYGPVDLLRVEEVEVPDPTGDQVVVAVRAAGINPGEASIRRGDLKEMFPSTFPSGQGSDLAGEGVGVGPDVSGFAVGDEVLGWSETRSSHATHTVVPAAQLIPLPSGLGWERAGSLFVAGTTAWAAVRAVAASRGETVVVSAAAGGVGSLVTPLLVEQGVRVVGIASEANRQWLEALGAIHVAYGEDLADRVREVSPDGVDALIDLFGPQYVDLALELGVAPTRINTIISFQRAAEVGASTDGSAAATDREVLAELAQRVADGRLPMEVAATYPLDQVAEAFVDLEQRHTRGKIVLTMP